MKRILEKIWRILWNLIKIGIVVVLVAVLVLGIYLYREYAKPILQLQSRAKEIAADSVRSDFSSALTSIIYAADGEKIATLRSARDAYYLTYEELPKYAVDVMLVTEDKKFYSHGGVDFLANIRAAIALIRHKGKITQGGSTITQQLARTVYLTNDVTYERKIVEIFLAWELEKRYSKTDILEFYMNNIYFSNSYYGLQAAAYGYFGKSAKELSLSQTVFLCAIPNNPALYDPYLHFDKTIERRDRMLRQMFEAEKITQAQFDAAVAEEITLTKQTVTRHNYVETYVYYCAIRALMEKDGFLFKTEFDSDEEKTLYEDQYDASYTYWQKQLYTGGYRVYTSIDLKLQERLQEAVDEGTAEFTELTEEGVYALQASAVCIDNRSGCVVAIVGGRGQDFAGYTLNRAYQSFRQPGSAIKPLIIYTPWFERGLSPDDILIDEKFEGGPVNSGGGYVGEITVRRAVEVSKNTIAWKLFEELTPEVGL
ncbi:MAG: transglycosylase domain-containing protein, partial [Lachnospiraceae bacterium]